MSEPQPQQDGQQQPPVYPQPPAYPGGTFPSGQAAVQPTAEFAPISATPYPPIPYSGVPAPQPLAKRSAAAVIFGILALVFLLAAGGVTTLYVLDRNSATKKSADQQVQIASLQHQLDDKGKSLDSTNAELRRTKADLQDAEAASKDCEDAVQAFWEAVKAAALAGKSTSPEATTATQKMFTTCKVRL